MAVGFGVFYAWIAVGLFQKANLLAGGMFLLLGSCCLILSIVMFMDLSPQEARSPAPRLAARPSVVEEQGSNLVELMRSNDAVRLEAVRTLLTAHGVAVHMLDMRGSTMLGFLPSVTARLLVARPELEKSLELLNSIPEDDRADS